MIRKWSLAVLLCAISVSLEAQDTSAYTPVGKLPLGDTLLSLPSPQIPSQGTYEVKFTHRFNQSLTEGDLGDQVHSLFGLDTNADVVFGFSYAIRRDLQFSLLRSNTNDTYELAAKHVVLQQAPAVPLNLSFRGGAAIRTEEDIDDRTSYFAQAILSRQISRRVEVFVLPTWSSNAGRAIANDRSVALFDHAFNVPLGIAFMIRRNLAVVAELIPPNQDLPDSVDADLGWALGIKRAIGGHWFEILLSNSQSTMADQYVTTTYQGAPLDAGDVRLGFNIERRFGRRR